MKCTGGSGCHPSANTSTICFLFLLPDQLRGVFVKTAELWLYKHNENTSTTIGSAGQDILEIAEVAQLEPNESVLFTQRVTVKDGWISADLSPVIKKWVQTQERERYQAIYVSCPTCEMGTRPPVSLEGNLKPFITVTTDYLNKAQRQKRSVNCSPGMEECCRENLNISFADLGWDKWIVQPANYNAHFCRGSCSLPNSVTYGSYYHSVIKQYKQLNPEKRDVVSCCTAEKLSSLEIIYTDGKGNLIKSVLPNMVVESCGCA